MAGEGKSSGNPSGTPSRLEFVPEARLSPFGISKSINDVLTQLTIQGSTESLESRNQMAREVGAYVNNILDALERERGLKRPEAEATSGLESTTGKPVERLNLGGRNSRPNQGRSVEEMYKESVAPFILDSEKRSANLNSQSGELAKDLRKALGLAEDAPVHLDNRTFNELVTAKREIYRPDYPHRTKQEFVPRDNVLKPIITPGAFLDIDCEKHVSEKIDEWLSLIRMTASAGILSPGSVYELCVAALMGTAQKYWKSLVAHTDIKEKIDQALTVDGVLAIIADALKREFCGFSLSTETVEKEQSLTALVKLQICDMCLFDSYVCEFQKYYYNLDVVSQQFILGTFFAKLPEPWLEVAQKAYELLLSEEKIVSGLGGKIQAVKYAMRKACTELQVKEAAKKLPYLNKSCCSQIEYVPGRYGCDTRSTPEDSLKRRNFPRKRKFVGYNKKKVWPKKDVHRKQRGGPAYKPRRFVRRRDNLKDKDRIDAFKRKHGREPKCPKGKPLSSCDCCWFCGSKDHKADSCPKKNQRRERLRMVFLDDRSHEEEVLAYEPVDECTRAFRPSTREAVRTTRGSGPAPQGPTGRRRDSSVGRCGRELGRTLPWFLNGPAGRFANRLQS
ncbi:hypothetical protein MLD38_019778 [Melastoma candidum]|uniref:Uncharacterized protein n=1 Tax=Melastoma candidum TaxID=119954 RepID=A0ACB9QZ68_9MYRT|nr:hypothetical protein MLD38_019778 [Melastoma candidum]